MAELKRIRVAVSSDAGCNWNAEDQEAYIKDLICRVESVYPGVTVEADIENIHRTRAFAYSSEGSFQVITSPDIEESITECCEQIAQDVWNDGNFWVLQS
jgi:hypothetical protein